MASADKDGAVKITVETTSTEAFDALSGATIEEKLKAATAANKVVVFGKSTCPFCIEVSRTFVDMSVPFLYYQIDKMQQGSQIHEELKKLTGQRTVPYVYISGMLVGGCDATKAMIASGEFDKKLGSLGGAKKKGDAENPTMIKLAGVDEDAPKVIGALLEFPNTVDNRVIRLTGLQIFFISLFIAIFSWKEEDSWRWLSVGMLVDFCLRFYGGAGISPLGCIAQMATAAIDLFGITFNKKTGPVWGAGPPKQFAVAVGIIFSIVIVVMQFTNQWEAATAFSATLCLFAGLEAFLNFCAGCLVFSYAIKFNIVPDSVYMVHINTLPETKYTWHEWTKHVKPPLPQRVVERFPAFLRGGKPTKIDLHYKTGKSDDWEREDFHIIKHVKIGFFTSVMGFAAIPAMFRFMSIIYGTPNLIWQILALLSLVYTAIILIPYLLKLWFYPRKVHKEWMHPVLGNAFSVPFMTLVVYAFLVEHYTRPLARVLFWMGAGPMLLISVIIVGEWLSRLRHDGHVNGSYQISPVGNFIVAVVGPIVDPSYTQVCFMWFGFASIMYITLFIWSFQKQVLGHNADPRGRMFSAIWMAAPSVAAIAWTVLTGQGQFRMDPVAQTLFYVGFTLFMVLVWMVWRRFLWADKFFMQMWAFGFPTAGLAWAAILYDYTIDTGLSRALAGSLISLACIVATVLLFRTLAGILRLKVFIPEHRWGPMSHLPLAQESMREMLHHLEDATDALASDPTNGRLADKVYSLWRAFSFVNSFYIKLKNDLCFPHIASWFPGHEARFVSQNNRMLEMQAALAKMMAEVGDQTPQAKGAAAPAASPTLPTALEGLPGTTPAEQMAKVAAKEPLVVVGRSTCPFCIEISRTLSDMGLPFVYYQLDNMAGGAELHASLKEATGQKSVPYVYIKGKMVGGCDATKALIASGEFDKMLGGSKANGTAAAGNMALLQAQVHALADFARQAFDDVEDHVRPVTRRYISLPVQKKIMNDCWDHGKPEEWFQAIPLVLQHLPMLGQRLTYIRAFLWAMPERCQQIGVMVALGVDPVNWYRIKNAIPDIIPRGEAGWKHF